jgi:hypothetical protein
VQNRYIYPPQFTRLCVAASGLRSRFGGVGSEEQGCGVHKGTNPYSGTKVKVHGCVKTVP